MSRRRHLLHRIAIIALYGLLFSGALGGVAYLYDRGIASALTVTASGFTQSQADARYVLKSGDTMTGPLTISADASPLLTVNRINPLNTADIRFSVGSTPKVDLTGIDAQPRFRVADPGIIDRLVLNTATGLLGNSLVPLSLLTKDDQVASNAGVVTVLSTTTTIVSLASLTVAIGDLVLIEAQSTLNKGATTGIDSVGVGKTAGTATIAWENNQTSIFDTINIGASQPYEAHLSGIARVTGAGTVTFSLQATSQGSNSTVPIDGGQLHGKLLRG